MSETNLACPKCSELQARLRVCEQELAVFREQDEIRRREQEWIQAYSEWFDGPEGSKAIAEAAEARLREQGVIG